MKKTILFFCFFVLIITIHNYLQADLNNTTTSINNDEERTPAERTYIIENNETYEFEIYLTNKINARHILFYNVSTETGTKDTV